MLVGEYAGYINDMCINGKFLFVAKGDYGVYSFDLSGLAANPITQAVYKAKLDPGGRAYSLFATGSKADGGGTLFVANQSRGLERWAYDTNGAMTWKESRYAIHTGTTYCIDVAGSVSGSLVTQGTEYMDVWKVHIDASGNASMTWSSDYTRHTSSLAGTAAWDQYNNISTMLGWKRKVAN